MPFADISLLQVYMQSDALYYHYIINILYQDARNTIGNIPVEWYNEYPHIGYNLDGERILKAATADEVGTNNAQLVICSTDCLRFLIPNSQY